jgi:hypothetical protein
VKKRGGGEQMKRFLGLQKPFCCSNKILVSWAQQSEDAWLPVNTFILAQLCITSSHSLYAHEKQK